MMTIKRTMMTLAISAALFAGFSLTATTASADELPACSSTLHTTTEPIELHYGDLWSYAYTLTWCADETTIAWVVPKVTHVEHSPTCTWRGNMEGWERPESGTNAWLAFDMSEFTCPGDNEVGTRGVTPWAKVRVYPNGSYDVLGKDIEV